MHPNTVPGLQDWLTYPPEWGPTEWGPIPFLPDNDVLVRRMQKQWGGLSSYRCGRAAERMQWGLGPGTRGAAAGGAEFVQVEQSGGLPAYRCSGMGVHRNGSAKRVQRCCLLFEHAIVNTQSCTCHPCIILTWGGCSGAAVSPSCRAAACPSTHRGIMSPACESLHACACLHTHRGIMSSACACLHTHRGIMSSASACLHAHRGIMTSASGQLVVPGLKAGNVYIGVQVRPLFFASTGLHA